MRLKRNVTLGIISNVNMIQCTISKWVHSSRSTWMYGGSSILWLGSFVIFLSCWRNLIYFYTVWNDLIVVTTNILSIKPMNLPQYSTFLAIFLGILCKIDDFIALRCHFCVSTVFERYLILRDVDSTSATGVWLSSISLTAELILIMKTCVG